MPVTGVNALITPSFQADKIFLPSLENLIDTAVKLYTTIRRSSCFFIVDQILIDSWLAVANTEEKSLKFKYY